MNLFKLVFEKVAVLDNQIKKLHKHILQIGKSACKLLEAFRGQSLPNNFCRLGNVKGTAQLFMFQLRKGKGKK